MNRQMGKTIFKTLYDAREQAIFMSDKEIKKMIKFCDEEIKASDSKFYKNLKTIFEQQIEINKMIDDRGKSDVFLGVFGILIALGVLLYFLTR
jgi:hypothetical protein